MIDKKTLADIKNMKDFIEFWVNFHSAYNEIISKEIISAEDEAKLLDTKKMIGDKYETLKNALEFKYAPHGRLTDPVSDILALTSIRFISEKNLKKLETNWKDSYVFLNNILERFENKRRRLEQFNPIGVFFKRILDRR